MLSIVDVSMSKITLWIISVSVDDWTAKRPIIASNVNSVHVDGWTVERAIIASNEYCLATLPIEI